jgi:hypothetical protein
MIPIGYSRLNRESELQQNQELELVIGSQRDIFSHLTTEQGF